MTVTVRTGENWNGEPTIENVEEIRETIESEDSLLPGGESIIFEVDDPHLNGNPTYLRITGYRKGSWFNVIDTLHEVGLVVADVWQYDQAQEDDRVSIKVVPKVGIEEWNDEN